MTFNFASYGMNQGFKVVKCVTFVGFDRLYIQFVTVCCILQSFISSHEVVVFQALAMSAMAEMNMTLGTTSLCSMTSTVFVATLEGWKLNVNTGKVS